MASFEVLRKKAYKILGTGRWMSSVSYGEREVTVCADGLDCHSSDRFDPEFTTDDVNVAVDYLYPTP